MKKETLQLYLKSVSKDYYDGHPTLPDEVFDRLAEIAKFEEVGAKQGDVPHLYPLLSLEKFYPSEGQHPNREFAFPIHSPKLDGACITAMYVMGRLVQVLTRGDGVRGKDITNKFADGRLLPSTIETSQPLQIVFEVVALKSVENSRNYCAGALNLKSLDEFRTRQIMCVAHGMTPSVKGLYDKDMGWLAEQGIEVVTIGDYSMYPQDGKVVRENSAKRFEEWGSTNHHPRGAYAIKERREAVQTKLLDVIWQVGKSGKVTPVAQLEPVVIDGATVSKASLHNIAFIEELGLAIGDYVEVIRSGDIIPYILGKVEQ